MTTKKTVKTPKTKTTAPRKPRAKKVEIQEPQLPVEDLAQPEPEEKGLSPDYLSIMQRLLQEPDRGLYISINQNTATILGFQCDISHVVDMAALAVFKAYSELDEESKQKLTLQQAATAFINRLSEIARTQGAKNASDDNAAVQETGQS